MKQMKRLGVDTSALFMVSWLIGTVLSPAVAEAPKRAATMAQSAASGQSLEGPSPRPGLSAEGVVVTQMQALQSNDSHDHGIEITYRFASPANKRQTGPFERFARMLKKSPYDVLLNASKISYGPKHVMQDQAQQEVTVTSTTGRETTFVFHLKRQKTPPYTDCWMTEAVSVKGVVNQLDVWGQAPQPGTAT
jgi:hypothetical protein